MRSARSRSTSGSLDLVQETPRLGVGARSKSNPAATGGFVPMAATGRGLSSAEAVRRLAADGPNLLPGSAPKSSAVIVRGVLTEPMFLMLLAAGGIYLALGSRAEALFLLGFVFVVIGITLVQERRTQRTLESLQCAGCSADGGAERGMAGSVAGTCPASCHRDNRGSIGRSRLGRNVRQRTDRLSAWRIRSRLSAWQDSIRPDSPGESSEAGAATQGRDMRPGLDNPAFIPLTRHQGPHHDCHRHHHQTRRPHCHRHPPGMRTPSPGRCTACCRGVSPSPSHRSTQRLPSRCRQGPCRDCASGVCVGSKTFGDGGRTFEEIAVLAKNAVTTKTRPLAPI